MESLIALLPGLLGVDPITFYAALGFVVTACNLIGRLIPDTATGTLGVIRKIAKVIGLYVGNRIAPGISNNDAAAVVASQTSLKEVKEAKAELKDQQEFNSV